MGQRRSGATSSSFGPTHRTGAPRSASPWSPRWAAPMDVAGAFQMPVLQPFTFATPPEEMWSFGRKPSPERRRQTLVHGYLDDPRLMPLADDPGRYVTLFSEFVAIVTPDFSMTVGMPVQDRIRSAWTGRAIGAYFQSRGLHVVPNVRWATLDDLDVVVGGLPCQGIIALSSQGLLRDKQLHFTFEKGIPVVLDRLKPRQVVFYGTMRPAVHEMLSSMAEILQFPTDIRRVFDERVA